VARLSQPASMSSATPAKIFFAKVKFDFIAEYLILFVLPDSPEASLLIESFGPAIVVWPSWPFVSAWAATLMRRRYAKALVGAMEVRAGAATFTGSVG
jgi:hypothetical protein